MSKRFEVGDHVILEMNDGSTHRCVVIEYDYPSMMLRIDDETTTDPDWENGEVVNITVEAVN